MRARRIDGVRERIAGLARAMGEQRVVNLAYGTYSFFLVDSSSILFTDSNLVESNLTPYPDDFLCNCVRWNYFVINDALEMEANSALI